MAVGAGSVQLHSEERARFYAGAPPVGNERLSVVGAVLTNSGLIKLTVALYGLQRFDICKRLSQRVSPLRGHPRGQDRLRQGAAWQQVVRSKVPWSH